MEKKLKPRSTESITEWAERLIAESRRAREKFKLIHKRKDSEETEEEEKNKEDSR